MTEVSNGTADSSPTQLGDISLKHDTVSALAVLRHPSSIGASFMLFLAFSVIASLRFGWSPRFWYLIPLLITLAFVIVLDLRTKTIPDVLTLPGIAYALAITPLIGSHSVAGALLGALTGAGIVLLLAVVSSGAVGGGDIKLMAMVGAALGWKGALLVLGMSQIAASVVAAGLLITRRAKRRDTFPVGSIIALVGVIMLLGES